MGCLLVCLFLFCLLAHPPLLSFITHCTVPFWCHCVSFPWLKSQDTLYPSLGQCRGLGACPRVNEAPGRCFQLSPLLASTLPPPPTDRVCSWPAPRLLPAQSWPCTVAAAWTFLVGRVTSAGLWMELGGAAGPLPPGGSRYSLVHLPWVQTWLFPFHLTTNSCPSCDPSSSKPHLKHHHHPLKGKEEKKLGVPVSCWAEAGKTVFPILTACVPRAVISVSAGFPWTEIGRDHSLPWGHWCGPPELLQGVKALLPQHGHLSQSPLEQLPSGLQTSPFCCSAPLTAWPRWGWCSP